MADLIQQLLLPLKKAGVEDDYRIVEYPELEDPFTKILKQITGDYETKMIKSKLGEYARYFDIYENAQKMQGMQTRMEYDLIIE